MIPPFRLVALGLAVVALGGAPPPATVRQDPGVSAPARDAAEKALTWLVAAQNTDGSWGDNPRMPGEVGATCIAALALLGEGSTQTRGRHYRQLQRALHWLDRRAPGWGQSSEQLDSSTLLQAKLGQNIDLYLLTLLTSQVLGNGDDQRELERRRGQMQQAVDRISALQRPDGQWETSYEPMLTTITAWLALRQASDAGITVKGASAGKVVEYLTETCLDRNSGVFREGRWSNEMRFVSQAGGLRVLYGMGEGDSADAQNATRVILEMSFDQDVGGRQGGEEFLGAMFAVQALHIGGGAVYQSFYDKVVTSLRSCQNRDGSWMGHHCITGRVFCTATSILTLLTPDQLLPMIEK